MYLQTSRLQYNLQKVGVFQTAHSDKKDSSLSLCLYYISPCRTMQLQSVAVNKNHLWAAVPFFMKKCKVNLTF